MDKIEDRKSFEVGGHRRSSEVIDRCGGMKKLNDHAEPTKVES